MNQSINQSQHISTLRQTQRAASSVLPVLTATVTVAGAVLAAMEARSARAAIDPDAASASRDAADGLTDASTDGLASLVASAPRAAAFARAPRQMRRLTVRGYLATLVGRVLLVALGIGVVLALVYLATATGRVGLAIILTALILFSLYLTEKVARH